MTAVFLLCTIILFVLQTLSMKLQHAEHLPQKLLVNCAFSLLAAAAMGAGRLAVPDMFTVSPATPRHCLRRAVRTDDLVLQPGHRQRAALLHNVLFFRQHAGARVCGRAAVRRSAHFHACRSRGAVPGRVLVPERRAGRRTEARAPLADAVCADLSVQRTVRGGTEVPAKRHGRRRGRGPDAGGLLHSRGLLRAGVSGAAGQAARGRGGRCCAKTLLPPCFWRAALWAAICCSPGWPGAWMPATCSRLYRAASLWA